MGLESVTLQKAVVMICGVVPVGILTPPVHIATEVDGHVERNTRLLAGQSVGICDTVDVINLFSAVSYVDMKWTGGRGGKTKNDEEQEHPYHAVSVMLYLLVHIEPR